MNLLAKVILYLVLAVTVAYLWLHFEAPHWNPFNINQ
jgi:hypothetical protein